MICEVCRTNQAIGVACTSQPYSCAYCLECAKQGADPEWIFEYLLEDVAYGDPNKIREGLVTYVHGKYLSFHQWVEVRKGIKHDQEADNETGSE